MIVDTHVHLIADDQVRYPLSPSDLGGGRPDWSRPPPASAEQLLALMDSAGVDRAVVVQALGAYGYDNSYHADMARLHSHRFVGVCAIDPVGVEAANQLEYWIKERGMRGVRLTANPDLNWLVDSRAFPVWERARDLGIPIVLFLRAVPLLGIRPILTRFHEVPVALDHMGRNSGRETYFKALFGLADLPNLFLKISTSNLTPSPEPDLDSLERLFEVYSQRIMWGSNYPASQGAYKDS